MTEVYLTGGDETIQATDTKWPGQTFRPTSTHTLQYIDLNLRAFGFWPNPAVLVYKAGADHKPFGNYISRDTRWLLNESFTPHDWEWFESWGKSLTENNPWTEYDFSGGDSVTLKNSQMSLYLAGNERCNLSVIVPHATAKLKGPSSRHLYFHHCCPETDHHPIHGFQSYLLNCAKGPDSFILEPIISRGTKYGPYPMPEHVIDNQLFWDEGRGPGVFDLTQRFIDGRNMQGEDPDPDGWDLFMMYINNEQHDATYNATLVNNFIGLAYQKFLPVPIDEYTIKAPWIYWPWETYRIRIQMQPVQLERDQYYAIVLISSGGLPPVLPRWQYDADDATYGRGVRIFSPDAGATWDVHTNDDHLFAEFGTPQVAPPPPPPPIYMWSIRDIQYEVTTTGVILTVTTNTPTHLTMLWSLETPWIHKRTITIRGLPTPERIQYCFTQFHTNEQEEPGDTLVHTFIKEPWARCEKRWFTFRGRIFGEYAVSMAPIFKYRPEGPLITTVKCIPTSGFIFVEDTDYTLLRNAWAGTVVDNWTYSFAGHGNIWGVTKIWRANLFFDTSFLTGHATIHSATIRLYGDRASNVNTDQYLYALQSPLVKPTGLTQLDYGKLLNANTPIAQFEHIVAGPRWDVNGWNELPIYENQLDIIIKNGITSIAFRSSLEKQGIPPVGYHWPDMFAFHTGLTDPTLNAELIIDYTSPCPPE